MCTPYKFLLVSFLPLSFFLFLVHLWKQEKKKQEKEIQDTCVWLIFFCSGSTTRYRKQLSLPEQQDFFKTMLNNWLHAPPKTCNATISCTEGADLMTEGNSDVQQCSGIRKHTPRAFDLPCLPLLCFHVHAFFSGGCSLLWKLFHKPFVYTSPPCTLLLPHFSSGHYSAALCDKDRQWHFYDGLNQAEARVSFVGLIGHVSMQCVNHIIYVNEF